MLKLWYPFALALIVVFALPILVIRTQPFEDRAAHALTQADCPAPCFMGIRPGFTTMQEAVYGLEAHEWVSTRVEEMPGHVQAAVYFDAGVPRTFIQWRWSTDLPAWIDAAQRGGLTLEDRQVQDVLVNTHLRLGEIVLAFGDPDETWISVFTRDFRRRFEYTAWYASEGLLVLATGTCPTRHYFDLPVSIRFRPNAPRVTEGYMPSAACEVS